MIDLYFFLFGTTKRKIAVSILLIILCALALNFQGSIFLFQSTIPWIVNRTFYVLLVLFVLLFILKIRD